MVTLQAGNAGGLLGFPLNAGPKSGSALSSQEFTKALSDAIAGTLERFGIDPKSFTIDLGPKSQSAARQGNVASQYSDIIASAASPTIPATVPDPIQSLNSAITGIGFNGLAPKDSAPQPVAPSTATAQHWYASDPVADAYWNKQPAAVRQLREIDDYGQRQALGAQLASQGYQIDVPIMVWGWDAGKTTDLRKGFGYTWVPSALQQSVSAAPGLTGGGIVPYDPANPRQGSINV